MDNKDFEEIYYTVKNKPQTVGDIDGYKPYEYRHPDIKHIAHTVKQSNNELLSRWLSMRAIAKHIINQNFLSEKDTIIPAPQHTGKAEYTLQIAKMIAKETGCHIADIIECTPRDTLYNIKKRKGAGAEIDTGLYLSGEIPTNTTLWFLDNVVASGKTFSAAKSLIPRLKPLPFAVSTRAKIEKSDEDDFKVIYGQK